MVGLTYEMFVVSTHTGEGRPHHVMVIQLPSGRAYCNRKCRRVLCTLLLPPQAGACLQGTLTSCLTGYLLFIHCSSYTLSPAPQGTMVMMATCSVGMGEGDPLVPPTRLTMWWGHCSTGSTRPSGRSCRVQHLNRWYST
jgi:hypothetical protein